MEQRYRIGQNVKVTREDEHFQKYVVEFLLQCILRSNLNNEFKTLKNKIDTL